MSKKARDEAAATLVAKQTADALAAVSLPSPEQVEAEAAACAAEEAANLAREAEEMAAEAAAKPTEGYDGPMLILRQRAKAGKYQKAANGQLCCSDTVALKLGTLPPEGVIAACMIALDITVNPYLHLNIGQQSMNLRNKLRHALKNGVFGFGVLSEAVDDVQASIDSAK
jgi:hypothetical protein